MAMLSSILAWRIPRTGEPGRLQSVESQRTEHNSCMDVRVGLQRMLSAEELMLLNCSVGEDS